MHFSPKNRLYFRGVQIVLTCRSQLVLKFDLNNNKKNRKRLITFYKKKIFSKYYTYDYNFLSRNIIIQKNI